MTLESHYRAYLAALNERRLNDLVHCTPRDRFLGFTPNGSRLHFAEHVFYRFRDNRIAEVSSLIDRASIAAQLAAPLPMPGQAPT
jgi:predicted ester cyclase